MDLIHNLSNFQIGPISQLQSPLSQFYKFELILVILISIDSQNMSAFYGKQQSYDRMQDAAQAEGMKLDRGRRSQQSSATLVCDYSERELNQLLVNTSEAMAADRAGLADATTAGKNLGAFGGAAGPDDPLEKYNQLTKLDDEEENVDFLQMFNQYHMQLYQKHQQPPQIGSTEPGAIQAGSSGTPPSHQVQYYYQQNNEQRSDRLGEQSNYTGAQSQDQPLGSGHTPGQRANPANRMSAGPIRSGGNLQVPDGRQQRKLGALRPGSATVAGQGTRFLASQQSKKRYEHLSQADQLTYSYQQPGPLMNNLVGKSTRPAQASYGQAVGTQRNSQAYGFGQQTSLMKPPFGSRKRTRPQSAARNQLQPAKNLQSVTNFTYQKAKQLQNQRAYLPESMKHTDKERLYEEKIELKKQVNEMVIANQQLKTQVQSQHAHIRQKDDMIQQVMKQVFVQPKREQIQSDDDFLQQFQEREINHNVGQKAAMLFAKGGAGVKFKSVAPAKITKQSALAAKDGQISALKLKMKEANDQCMAREKELSDLKQTLKFTKIKEYETELALNVQESQRLRILLEREISKPKIDPVFIQGLRQQSMQQQQIIQNMQRNSQIQQDNYEKLNRKMVVQIKKFAKLKEARKKLAEKSIRNEKKVLILNRKVRQLEEEVQMHQRAQAQHAKQQKARQGSYGSSTAAQQQKQFNHELMKYQQRYDEQNKIIEKLLNKLHDNDIKITPEDLLDEKEGEEIEEGVDLSDSPHAEELADQRPLMDLIVTVAGQGVSESAQSSLGLTKELKDTDFQTMDELKDQLRKAFQLPDDEAFTVKHVTDDGAAIDLQDDNWQELRAAQDDGGQGARVQLVIELENAPVEEEQEESNYDDDGFEEAAQEKVYQAPITFEEVKIHFEELRLILAIKKVKKTDALKYLLHGLKDQDTNKKVKKVTIQNLADAFEKKVGFPDSEVAMKLAKHLIEQPNDDGKIELMDNADFAGQTHAEAVSIKRKDLHAKLDELLQGYMIYNGLAITSLLSQIQNMFESAKDDLRQELEDQDYDDEGTASMEDIWKSMQLCGLYPKSFDDDVRNFLMFLAMRHSRSLAQVDFKRFVKAFEEDYNLLEDGPSRWESTEPYEPSEDEGELESDKPPEPEVEEAAEAMEPGFAGMADSQQMEEASAAMERSPGQIQDLEQNELLEKVDEILMQIVQRLPPTQKIRTLTHLMLPFLTPVFDQEKQRQFLIISQAAFIQFLLGQNKNQLGLQLEESHVVCMLHLLVQEDDDEPQENGADEGQPDNKFILYDEFIELVKTYMKKELIMQQSKSLGINYDVLGKESVEFLFQLRSSLMYDNQNINENSADEDELEPGDVNFGAGGRSKKPKSVPTHVREIFNRIIQNKNIQLNNARQAQQRGKRPASTQVEVMDFDQMIDALEVRLSIPTPSVAAQEELKYLLCLDFKYLEMVMLLKLDKVMQDLDYISIDLLRHAQDQVMEQSRQMAIAGLRKVREDQLATLKLRQAGKQKAAERVESKYQQQNDISSHQGTQSSQLEVQGVSHSTKQEKKRKRPDDKRQNVAKKAGAGRNQQQQHQQQWGEQDQFGGTMNSGPNQNRTHDGVNANRAKGNFDQDHSAGKSGGTQNSMAKDRYAPSQGSAAPVVGPLQYQVNSQDRSAHQAKESGRGALDVESQDLQNAASQRQRRSNRQQQDQAIEEEIEDVAMYPSALPGHPQVASDDFDNIDVNLDVDIHKAEKMTANKQMAIAAEIVAAANNGSEFDEDNLQDDIPIDDDYDDDLDGIISDNYENYADNKKAQAPAQNALKGAEAKKEQKTAENAINSALDENAFSMDHSDDLEASPQMRVALQKGQEEQKLQPFNQKKLKQPPAVGTRPGGGASAAQLASGMDRGMSSNESAEDIDDEDLGMDMDAYPTNDDDIDDEIEDAADGDEDDVVDEAIEVDDEYRRIESQLAQKQSARRQSTKLVDEDIGDYPGDELEESEDDIVKESNDDMAAQVAQGRLNFNKFGKDSSIQQEHTRGHLVEDDFDDNGQSSQIEDESPEKGAFGSGLKDDDDLYDAAAHVDDQIVEDEIATEQSEAKEKIESEIESATPDALDQESEAGRKKLGEPQTQAAKEQDPEEYIVDEDETSPRPEEIEENLSSRSPQQIAQDTKEPEGPVAHGQGASNPGQALSSSNAAASSKNAPGTNTSQQNVRESSNLDKKSEAYSAAFEDDYEI